MDRTNSKPIGLLNGMHYGFPIEGAIRTGRTFERRRGDKVQLLPEKLDEFTLTLKVKAADGEWERHPLDAKLREQHGIDTEAGRKLRRIPIVVAFDRPELSVSEQFAAFDNQGRPICAGNGKEAMRRSPVGEDYKVEPTACPGSSHCEFGQQHRCDALLRLSVRIQGQHEGDGLFILRTGSINAVSDTRAYMEYLHKMLRGRLAGVPLWLTLEAKQSSMSKQSVFWHASFRPRFESFPQLAKAMQEARQAEAELGLDRKAAEEVLAELRSNGAFAEMAEEDGEQLQELLVGRATPKDADVTDLLTRVEGGAPPSQVNDVIQWIKSLGSASATAQPSPTPPDMALVPKPVDGPAPETGKDQASGIESAAAPRSVAVERPQDAKTAGADDCAPDSAATSPAPVSESLGASKDESTARATVRTEGSVIASTAAPARQLPILGFGNPVRPLASLPSFPKPRR